MSNSTENIPAPAATDALVVVDVQNDFTENGNLAVKKTPNAETPLTQASGKFDAVLVDGRWRLACGLAALRALKPTSRVMVHDYFEEAGRSHAASHHTERGEYDKLLPWYHLVEEARELAVFAPKEEVLSGLRNGTLTDKYEKAIEEAYHNAMRLNQHDAISPPRHAVGLSE